MIGLLYTYTYCSDAVAPCVRELYVYVYSCTCTRRAIGEVRCRVVHILYHMYMYIATYSTVQMCMAYGTSGSNSGSISVLPYVYSKLYNVVVYVRKYSTTTTFICTSGSISVHHKTTLPYLQRCISVLPYVYTM